MTNTQIATTWPFNALIARAARVGMAVRFEDVQTVQREGNTIISPADKMQLYSAIVAIEGPE